MKIKNELSNAVKMSLMNYVNEGTPTGNFLYSVLTNNLFEAVGRADEKSLMGLPHLVKFIYNEVPCGCYGSPEKVKEWKGYKCLEMIVKDDPMNPELISTL